MKEWLIGGGVMTGMGMTFGIILALAYRFLRVEEDPRIDTVEGLLPGTNCGACGEPGCRAFAEQLVARKVQPGGCTVSSPDALQDIASFLGVDAGLQERRVARIHCAGGHGLVSHLAVYRGIGSCRGAVLINGGGRACAWGCIGLGDCARACTFGAIRMNQQELPVVEPDRCTACNDCVEVCPMDLFTLVPVSHKVVVQCASPMMGDAARSVCDVACDGCGKCVADSAPGVMEMAGGLPVILEPAGAKQDCTFRCPTGAIRWVEGAQFES